MSEPTPLDLVCELRAALGMFNGAMPIAPQEAWKEALARAEALTTALRESVKLQSHYAELLNMHDGGARRTFTIDTWLARLRETRTIK